MKRTSYSNDFGFWWFWLLNVFLLTRKKNLKSTKHQKIRGHSPPEIFQDISLLPDLHYSRNCSKILIKILDNSLFSWICWYFAIPYNNSKSNKNQFIHHNSIIIQKTRHKHHNTLKYTHKQIEVQFINY